MEVNPTPNVNDVLRLISICIGAIPFYVTHVPYGEDVFADLFKRVLKEL